MALQEPLLTRHRPCLRPGCPGGSKPQPAADRDPFLLSLRGVRAADPRSADPKSARDPEQAIHTQAGQLSSSRPEVDALLAAPDRNTWSGRRDHAFIITAVQTGLRLSEMTGLKRENFVSGSGAHLRVVGKGRKERCTPLAKPTRAVLNTWLREPPRGVNDVLFPSARGERLTVHGIQYLLNKHRVTASTSGPSLKNQRVTVHRLRHTAAMDLLQAGVDRAVIALWLGHESVETTQIYLEATLAMKERALATTTAANRQAQSLPAR